LSCLIGAFDDTVYDPEIRITVCSVVVLPEIGVDDFSLSCGRDKGQGDHQVGSSVLFLIHLL